jgi:hypothetical protein
MVFNGAFERGLALRSVVLGSDDKPLGRLESNLLLAIPWQRQYSGLWRLYTPLTVTE